VTTDLRHVREQVESVEEVVVDAFCDEQAVALLDLEEDLLEITLGRGSELESRSSLSPAEPLVDAAAYIGDCLATVPELAALFGCHAFRDLGAQLLAVGSEELLAFVQETQSLADDLVDRLKAAGLELGADELLDFVGQRRQVHAKEYTGVRRGRSGLGREDPYPARRGPQGGCPWGVLGHPYSGSVRLGEGSSDDS
jgi:hypothetical protein